MPSTTLHAVLRGLALATLLVLASTHPPAAAAQAASTAGPCTERSPNVNVNTASAAELESLPRIGPARARAILQMRAHLGRFRRVSQLLRVKGIGRATLRQLLPLIRLADPPPDADDGEPPPDPVPLEGN